LFANCCCCLVNAFYSRFLLFGQLYLSSLSLSMQMYLSDTFINLFAVTVPLFPLAGDLCFAQLLFVYLDISYVLSPQFFPALAQIFNVFFYF